MTIRFFFNGKDERCLKFAERLVQETEAEIVHSDGMPPMLWMKGVLYHGMDRIQEVLQEAGVIDA